MDEKKALIDLIGNTHNLEISIMAITNRLALVEAFNSQLAQGQIDIREVMTKLMNGSQQAQAQSNLNQVVSDLVKTVDQMKATQNMLMVRLKAFSG
jgi:hypothetical protein